MARIARASTWHFAVLVGGGAATIALTLVAGVPLSQSGCQAAGQSCETTRAGLPKEERSASP